MQRSFVGLCFCFLLAGCGTALPIAQDFNHAIAQGDPGYGELTLRLAAVDHLSISGAEMAEAKSQLTAMAGYVKSLNQYFGSVATVNRDNQSLSSGYGWANGVIGGLGALLATLDSKRNYGPVAGGIGAVWTALGLTLQKAYVDPRVSGGTAEVAKIADVRKAVDDATVAWQTLTSAPAAGTPATYASWLVAARAANDKAKDILGVIGVR